MKVAAPSALTEPLEVPRKLLMGPGPSNCPTNVLQAMSNGMLGHLHAETLKIMDDIKAGIQYVFQTENAVTMCVSGSGHAGMEMALCNLIERGDVVLIGTTGHWGLRAADMAHRYGAKVHSIEAPQANRPIKLVEFTAAIAKHRPRLLFVAQGDSSTGVLQTQLRGIGDVCRKFDCIFVVDTVASLGGTDFLMDEWSVDIAYTGSQKVLSAPPGITPISFSERAIERIRQRKSPVPVYYFDVLLIAQYWGCFGNQKNRIYHHTISVSLLYGLREALAMIAAQGLQQTIERHKKCSKRLQNGLKALNLELFVPEEIHRLPTVTTVMVPKNIDWKAVIDYAMKNYRLEIAGGLGPTVNKVFRIGLMGMNATTENVDSVLMVLGKALKGAGLDSKNLVSKL